MRVIELDDESLLIPINKRQHRYTIESETESSCVLRIDPIERPSLDRMIEIAVNKREEGCW